jgi:4-hydroxyphenylpyruvate dioxygenase-like putative hemolysin
MVENVESKIDHVENSVENVESTRKSAFYFQLRKVETVEMLDVLQFV